MILDAFLEYFNATRIFFDKTWWIWLIVLIAYLIVLLTKFSKEIKDEQKNKPD